MTKLKNKIIVATVGLLLIVGVVLYLNLHIFREKPYVDDISELSEADRKQCELVDKIGEDIRSGKYGKDKWDE